MTDPQLDVAVLGPFFVHVKHFVWDWFRILDHFRDVLENFCDELWHKFVFLKSSQQFLKGDRLVLLSEV